MKRMFYSVLRTIREIQHENQIMSSNKYDKNRINAELIRNVHSIEKGLSIQAPRKGFGIKKMLEMFDLAYKYMSVCEDKTVLYFVVDAVKSYLAYHEEIGYFDDDIKAIQLKVRKLEEDIGDHEGVYGGYIVLDKSDRSFSRGDVEQLFSSRHSIREFSGEGVPEESLKKAIKMAQRAPSACNRQAVRVYNISSKSLLEKIDDLGGIGGFAKDVDRYLLITGVESAYRPGEPKQFIVSAVMFAAYLTLSLNCYDIGSCVIQRSLFPNESYNKLKKIFKIGEDEQVVIMLGIGMMKHKTKVPLSRRFELEQIYKKLD